MTTLKEFQEKINKIQDKVNLKEESHQKNKTLLQIIRDICNDTLKEPNLKEEVKNEAKKILKRVENDLSSLKVGIHQEKRIDYSKISKNNISIGGYAPAPINNVLNSVHAGAFDPLSSPILRNLQKKSKIKTKKEIKQKKPEKVKKQKEEPVKPQQKPKEKPKEEIKKKTEEKIEKKQDTKKKVEQKVIEKEPKKASTPKKATKPKKKTEKKTISKKKSTTTSEVKEKITPLISASLEIEQIQLTIQLPFKNSIELLGRQDFDKENLAIQIPTEFFSPILMRDPENKEAKEHCAIEQTEPKKYLLKDRFNLKKTYFQGKFVDSDGTQLKEGDKFILPVMVNEQLSSLTVIFHIKNQKEGISQ